MFATMRAELLVLRKWPAAWGLLLVLPVLTLTVSYIVTFVTYVTETPAQYAQLGSPAQNLPTMLPSQFVIAATSQFAFSGLAPFIVLGAMMAGGDWRRGTIRTSLLQEPGRLRTLGGQVLALAAAAAASVVATFAVCAAASLVVARLEAGAVVPPTAAWPAIWLITRGLGTALLIAFGYTTAGLALGTVCRNAAGAIAIALLWTVIIEGNVYDMGIQAGGTLLKITNFLPGSDAVTLISVFGSVGQSHMYLPMSPARAAWTLAGYTAAFLAVTAILLHARDVADRPRSQTRRHAAAPLAADPGKTLPSGQTASSRAAGWAAGVLACLRAELLILRKRPAAWGLLLALPADMLISVYVTGYVYYRTAGNGAGVDAPELLAFLSPGQYLSAPLTVLGIHSGLYGATVFTLLGALVAGSDWGRGTIRTTLLQGPGRLRTRLGQDLAVLIATAASVALTFIAAAAASGVVAATQAGALLPDDSHYPAFPHLAGAIGGALMISIPYAAIGLALGTLLRSDAAATGVAVLWAVVIQYNLDNIGSLNGVLRKLYEILPDASANTLGNLYNSVTTPVLGTVVMPPFGVRVLPAVAVLTLALYAVACLAMPALLTRRRDIA